MYLVEDYASGASIQALVNKPHHSNKLINAAYEKLNTPEPSTGILPTRKASTNRAAVIIKPSSELEHDDEDDYDDIDEDEDVSVHEGEDTGNAFMNENGQVPDDGEVMVKEEDAEEEYLLHGEFYGDDGKVFEESASASLDLEVDGLQIISVPPTRACL